MPPSYFRNKPKNQGNQIQCVKLKYVMFPNTPNNFNLSKVIENTRNNFTVYVIEITPK